MSTREIRDILRIKHPEELRKKYTDIELLCLAEEAKKSRILRTNLKNVLG